MAPAPDLQAAKKALRARVLAQRDALDASMRREASAVISRRLCADPRYQAARIVAAYASFGSEFDTSAFLADAMARDKALVLPRIDKANARLELRRITDPKTDLVSGVWGIQEPALHCESVPAEAVDFMLVPGVAFTRSGDRLGYGGGYYDRLMTGLRLEVPRIAAAYAMQVVEDVPMGERDQRVTGLVSEA